MKNAASARSVHGADGRPWYREPWPWFLMAGPAAVIVAGMATAWIAFATSDGLVAEDWYKRGLAINQDIRREQAAIARGLKASVTREPSRLRVRLEGAAPEALLVHLAHATRAGHDLRLRLARAPDGAFDAALPPLAAGRWHVVIEDPRREWRIVQEGL